MWNMSTAGEQEEMEINHLSVSVCCADMLSSETQS